MTLAKLTIPELADEIRSSKNLRSLWAFLAFLGAFAFFLGFWPEPLPEFAAEVPGLNFVYTQARTFVPPWALALGGVALSALSVWRAVIVHAHLGALQARFQQLRLEQQKRVEKV